MAIKTPECFHSQADIEFEKSLFSTSGAETQSKRIKHNIVVANNRLIYVASYMHMPKMMMSAKIVSHLYVVVALLQTCLIDARSLRGPRQSTFSAGGFIGIDIDQDITRSRCLVYVILE